MNKLSSRRGETLAETLAALLIVALVSAALAAMLSAASRINGEMDRRDLELLTAANLAEDPPESVEELPLELTLNGEGQGGKTVRAFRDEDTGLCSYWLEEAGT